MKSTAKNSKKTGRSRRQTSHSGASSLLNNLALVHVVEAEYRGGHRVWLRFNDGLEGEVDLVQELSGGVFEPLRDEAYFASFVVDETLTWPNGADFAPEFLYDLVLNAARPRRTRARQSG